MPGIHTEYHLLSSNGWPKLANQVSDWVDWPNILRLQIVRENLMFVAAAFDELPERMQIIIAGRFLAASKKTFREIGQNLMRADGGVGVCSQTVLQLERRALRQLTANLRRMLVPPFEPIVVGLCWTPSSLDPPPDPM